MEKNLENEVEAWLIWRLQGLVAQGLSAGVWFTWRVSETY